MAPLVITIFTICTFVSYVTSVIASRHFVTHRRKPSYAISATVTLATLVFTMWIVTQGSLFDWEMWTEGIPPKYAPLRDWVPAVSMYFFPFAAVPSVLVVRYYRKKFMRNIPSR